MFTITRMDYATGELKTIENRKTTKECKTLDAALKWLGKNAWLFYEDIGAKTSHRVLIEVKEGDNLRAAFMSMVEITSRRVDFVGGEAAISNFVINRQARLIEVTDSIVARVKAGVTPLQGELSAVT